MTGGFKDVYSGRDGCITSSSLEYMEIHPLYTTPESTPTHPTPETQPDQKDSSKDSSKAVNVPARPPSSLGAHSWTPASKEPNKDTPPSPWYKLTNGELCQPRHVSAFQLDRSYLKKATIPTIPVLIVEPQPKKAPVWISSTAPSGSPPSSMGSDKPNSHQHRIKFPSLGIGHIFKRKFQLPPFKPERVLEVESPTPYHMQTLICTTGALKTLC